MLYSMGVGSVTSWSGSGNGLDGIDISVAMIHHRQGGTEKIQMLCVFGPVVRPQSQIGKSTLGASTYVLRHFNSLDDRNHYPTHPLQSWCLPALAMGTLR